MEKTYRLGEHLFTPTPTIGKDWDSADKSVRASCRAKQYTTLLLRTYEPLDRFVDILRSLETCDAWSYILHDKDANPDGTLKEPHIHALLHFPPDGRIRITTLVKLFKHNTRVEIPLDVQSCLDYFLHTNQPDKYQYEADERISHNTAVLLGTRSSSSSLKEQEARERNAEFVSDLCQLAPYDLAIKYGRDYMRNQSRYNEFRRSLDCFALSLDERSALGALSEAFDEVVFCPSVVRHLCASLEVALLCDNSSPRSCSELMSLLADLIHTSVRANSAPRSDKEF